MSPRLFDELPALLRDAAERCIVPRFRQLQRHEVEEKSPGEMVTIADREVEALLTPALRALQPGSRVVGEEAASAEPSLLQDLDDGDVWLLDPLDGTNNFIAGRPDFGILVALLRHGETAAAWLLDPIGGTLCMAERGAGAWCDGQRMRVPAQGVLAR